MRMYEGDREAFCVCVCACFDSSSAMKDERNGLSVS